MMCFEKDIWVSAAKRKKQRQQKGKGFDLPKLLQQHVTQAASWDLSDIPDSESSRQSGDRG